MHSRKLIVLLMMIVITTSSAVSVFAAQDHDINTGGQDSYAAAGILPPDNLSISPSDDIGTIMKKSKGFYSFTVDEDDTLFGGISLAEGVNSIANILFGLSKAAIRLSANITKYALSGDIFKTLRDFMAKPGGPLEKISKLTQNAFARTDSGINGLIWLGVAFSMAAVVILYARRQTAGAFGKIFSTILIMVFLSSYIILPTMFMTKVQAFTDSIGASLLGGSASGSPGDAAAKKLWLMGVDMPWQELEFGSIIAPISDSPKADGALQPNTPANTWLSMLPSERDAEAAATTFAGDPVLNELVANMEDNVSTQAGRVGESFLILILDLVLGLMFILLSCLVIGFQIGSIIMWLLGFFVLIVALFPTHGTGKIREWAGMIALTYFGQIVAYVVIMLVVEIMGAFYSLGSLVATFGAMIGLIIGLLIMKNQVFRLFSPDALGGSVKGGGGIADMSRSIKSKGAFTAGVVGGMTANAVRARSEEKAAKRDAKIQEYQQKIHNNGSGGATDSAKRTSTQRTTGGRNNQTYNTPNYNRSASGPGHSDSDHSGTERNSAYGSGQNSTHRSGSGQNPTHRYGSQASAREREEAAKRRADDGYRSRTAEKTSPETKKAPPTAGRKMNESRRTRENPMAKREKKDTRSNRSNSSPMQK